MQFLNPVTQNSERCPGTWSHPGKEIRQRISYIQAQVFVNYTKPCEVNLSLGIVFSVLW